MLMNVPKNKLIGMTAMITKKLMMVVSLTKVVRFFPSFPSEPKFPTLAVTEAIIFDSNEETPLVIIK